MLKVFYSLKPFFEDVYREISVREYSRLNKISAPTASKLLKKLTKEQLLFSSKKGIYLFFRANRNYPLFKSLALAYWQNRLYNLLEKIHKNLLFKKIILFGSIAKVENTIDSDVDLYIDFPRKDIDVKDIEKKLNRKIQFHFENSLKNLSLKKNIEKGILIR